MKKEKNKIIEKEKPVFNKRLAAKWSASSAKIPKGNKNNILFTKREVDKSCAKKINIRYKILRLPTRARLK